MKKFLLTGVCALTLALPAAAQSVNPEDVINGLVNVYNAVSNPYPYSYGNPYGYQQPYPGQYYQGGYYQQPSYQYQGYPSYYYNNSAPNYDFYNRPNTNYPGYYGPTEAPRKR